MWGKQTLRVWIEERMMRVPGTSSLCNMNNPTTHEYNSFCPSVTMKNPHKSSLKPKRSITRLAHGNALYRHALPQCQARRENKSAGGGDMIGDDKSRDGKKMDVLPAGEIVKSKTAHDNRDRRYETALPQNHNPWPTSLPVERRREGPRVGAIMTRNAKRSEKDINPIPSFWGAGFYSSNTFAIPP